MEGSCEFLHGLLRETLDIGGLDIEGDIEEYEAIIEEKAPDVLEELLIKFIARQFGTKVLEKVDDPRIVAALVMCRKNRIVGQAAAAAYAATHEVESTLDWATWGLTSELGLTNHTEYGATVQEAMHTIVDKIMTDEVIDAMPGMDKELPEFEVPFGEKVKEWRHRIPQALLELYNMEE